MLRCLGDYLLCSVTRSYNGQKLNRHRACWYVVFEVDLLRVNLSNANLLVEHVMEKLSEVNLSVNVNLLKEKLLGSKVNMSCVGWIIILEGEDFSISMHELQENIKKRLHESVEKYKQRADLKRSKFSGWRFCDGLS